MAKQADDSVVPIWATGPNPRLDIMCEMIRKELSCSSLYSSETVNFSVSSERHQGRAVNSEVSWSIGVYLRCRRCHHGMVSMFWRVPAAEIDRKLVSCQAQIREVLSSPMHCCCSNSKSREVMRGILKRCEVFGELHQMVSDATGVDRAFYCRDGKDVYLHVFDVTDKLTALAGEIESRVLSKFHENVAVHLVAHHGREMPEYMDFCLKVLG